MSAPVVAAGAGGEEGGAGGRRGGKKGGRGGDEGGRGGHNSGGGGGSGGESGVWCVRCGRFSCLGAKGNTCPNPPFCCFCGRGGDHVSAWCPNATQLSQEGRLYGGSKVRVSGALVQARTGLPSLPAASSAPPSFGHQGPFAGGVGGVAPPLFGDGGLSVALASQFVPFVGQMMGAALNQKQFVAGPPRGPKKQKQDPAAVAAAAAAQKDARKRANLETDRQLAAAADQRRRERAAAREEEAERERERRVAAAQEAREGNLGAQGRYERDLELLLHNFVGWAADRVLSDMEGTEVTNPREGLERLRDRSRTLVGLWVSENRRSGDIRQVSSFFRGPEARAPPEEPKEGDDEEMKES